MVVLVLLFIAAPLCIAFAMGMAALRYNEVHNVDHDQEVWNWQGGDYGN